MPRLFCVCLVIYSFACVCLYFPLLVSLPRLLLPPITPNDLLEYAYPVLMCPLFARFMQDKILANICNDNQSAENDQEDDSGGNANNPPPPPAPPLPANFHSQVVPLTELNRPANETNCYFSLCCLFTCQRLSLLKKTTKITRIHRKFLLASVVIESRSAVCRPHVPHQCSIFPQRVHKCH